MAEGVETGPWALEVGVKVVAVDQELALGLFVVVDVLEFIGVESSPTVRSVPGVVREGALRGIEEPRGRG